MNIWKTPALLLALAVGLIAPNPVMAQDSKEDKEKKKAVEAQKKIQIKRLKRQLRLVKRQNQLLQRRIKTYQFMMRTYQRRLAQSRNPMEQLLKRVRHLGESIERELRRANFDKLLRRLKRNLPFGRDKKARAKRVPPRYKRTKRSYKRKGKANKANALNWYHDIREAKKVAAKTNKPLLVKVGATWCGPCQKMDAACKRNKALQRQLKKFVLVKIDSDRQKAVARSLKTRGIPLVVVYNGKGEEVSRIVGYSNARRFVGQLKKAYGKATAK